MKDRSKELIFYVRINCGEEYGPTIESPCSGCGYRTEEKAEAIETGWKPEENYLPKRMI